MKRKFFFHAVSVLLLLFFGYGCSNDDFLTEREVKDLLDDQWKVVYADIKGSDWERVDNEKEGFYMATINLPELNANIFDDGAVIAYYLFNSDAKTALPYVKTTIGDNGVPFTDTYSCDFQLGNPSTATFFLEASNAGGYVGNPPAATFQIVLIY